MFVCNISGSVPQVVTTSATPPYLSDIRAQPDALARLLQNGLSRECRQLLTRMKQFDRIVLTGMGSSLQGCWPLYLRLAEAGLPVWWVETAELLGPAGGLLTPRTLLWIVSQSGASAEVTALLAQLPVPRPQVLGTTNDTASTLAQSADAVLELHSGAEHTVSTKSYVNTLAALALAGDVITDATPEPELQRAPNGLAEYLTDWPAHQAALDAAVPEKTIFVLGRGASLAAANTGALIIKEAAKHPVEGMSAPQFRHGPLELARPGVAVVLLAGSPAHHANNQALFHDIGGAGANAIWLAADAPGEPHRLPVLGGSTGRTIAEILPLQVLSVVLADRAGLEPGAFQRIGKVTQQL